MKLAEDILARYSALDHEARRLFFIMLTDSFSPDWETARAAWQHHQERATRTTFQELVRALEPLRQELFRRLNRARGGTPALVQMRSDLLSLMADAPDLGMVDDDLLHLLRSWFNRGFLVMERIDWSTSADILERIIRYEAVHHIGDWDELRRRLLPPDRRCYGFFHPALAQDPLIFVEVALTTAVPATINSLLAPDRTPIEPESATTAVFYSISNCQPGLQGISFGNFLIKQVVEQLLRELPALSTFVTLSPVPRFGRWLVSRADDLTARLAGLASAGDEERAAAAAEMMPLAAEYLLNAKDAEGRPLDPVARLWPQTERIKAGLALGADEGELADACRGMKLYLDTAPAGLWRDRLQPDGTWVDEPAPASSFYHIICALNELFAA